MPNFTFYEFVSRTITVSGSTATVECTNRQQVDNGTVQEEPATLLLIKSDGQWLLTSISG